MKLTAPYSGVVVVAVGEQAEKLIANGYKPAEEAEKPKRTTRKRSAKPKE